jgi:hypothetical protein
MWVIQNFVVLSKLMINLYLSSKPPIFVMNTLMFSLMKTLTKYSYYESSNGKWVKVLVAVDGVKSHPKDKINVVFGERTVDVFVKDYWEGHTLTIQFHLLFLNKFIKFS